MNTRTKSLFGYIFPALGAVNIAVPFITFVIAIAAMFPMGGATVVAIRMGVETKREQIMPL